MTLDELDTKSEINYLMQLPTQLQLAHIYHACTVRIIYSPTAMLHSLEHCLWQCMLDSIFIILAESLSQTAFGQATPSRSGRDSIPGYSDTSTQHD